MPKNPRQDRPQELVFTALGGLGEIGMNLYLYGLGRNGDYDWLMVDLGITFPGGGEPGVDVIFPDIRYIEERRRNLQGIVLTHGHEDHIGAVIELWPRLRAPIYATPFTAALLKAKLAEEGSDLKLPINILPMEAKFEIGGFALEFVTVAHSIPEPNALVVRAAGGVVVHTADWKIDRNPITGKPTNEARFRELGAAGVDVLISDSTNVLRDGISPSEEDVGKTLTDLILKADKRVAVTTFASNLARVKVVGEAARAAGRQLVVAGRALHRVIEVGRETGYLDRSFRYLDQDMFQQLPRDKVVVLVTGSQGEPRAALARIAAKEHPAVQFAAGDTVIFSSRTIPGNEESIGRIQNGLADQGVLMVTDSDALVHVTGHPRRGELLEMFEWVKPKTLVPMHGEARHLEAHARLGSGAGIGKTVSIRNGHMLRLLPGPVTGIDEVPVGRLYRDGDIIIEAEDGTVRQRRKLSFAGIVAISVVLEANGEIAADPLVSLDGIPAHTAKGSPMDETVLDAVEGALESIPRARRRDPALVREAVERAARSAVNTAWGKKPICRAIVTML